MALFTATPVALTPTSPYVLVDASMPRFFGPYRSGGSIWGSGFRFPFSGSPAGVFKSADSGATWAAQDQANSPSINEGFGYIDFAFVDSTIHILGRRNSANRMTYCPFDLATGVYGSAIDSSLAAGGYKIAVRANSDPVVFFTKNVSLSSIGQPIQYSVISGGAFGTPVDLDTPDAGKFFLPLDALLDSGGTLHLLYQKGRQSGTAENPSLRYLALDSSGGFSAPSVVDTNLVNNHFPYYIGGGVIWGDHLLWAANLGSSVVLYDGTPLSAPVWTKRTVTTLSPNSTSISFNAPTVLSGGVPYIFWYYFNAGAGKSQVEYCTFDGSSFTAPAIAWDAFANPYPGDPLNSEIDAFALADVGTGFDLMALEYITAGFDQSIVFLSNATAQAGYENTGRLSWH